MSHAQPIPLGSAKYPDISFGPDTFRIQLDTGGWVTTGRVRIYPSDPCRDQMYWPLQVSEPCESNPMHCRHCGKEIKVGESFCYVVMKATPGRKFADYIHVRCAIKRIQ